MTNEICPHCKLLRQGAHSCMHSMRAEIEQLRADISQAYDLRDKAEGRYCTALEAIEQLHAAVKTAQELAARRLMEIERLRGEAEVADEQLAQLRGFAEAHKTCRGSDEPCEQCNPFDSAAILAAPHERRISMSFQAQEQYEAALVFLDMADEGASRDASPADLVGALQDVVHTDPGPVRAGHAVKSDVTRGPCAVCGTTDDHHGFGCPVG